MGDAKKDALRVGFDNRLKLKFLGSQITTNAGLLAYRELDEARGLTAMSADVLTDLRQGSNKQHLLVPPCRHGGARERGHGDPGPQVAGLVPPFRVCLKRRRVTVKLCNVDSCSPQCAPLCLGEFGAVLLAHLWQ